MTSVVQRKNKPSSDSTPSMDESKLTASDSKSTTAANKNSNAKTLKPANRSASCFPRCLKFLLRFALCLGLAAVLNSVIGSHNDSSIEKHLRETKQISYFNVNGLDVMYRCVVREGVVPTRTVWIVHGVSASWLIQSPPTHFLHEQLRDAQVCSYARPGRGFTSQSTDDFTVDAIVEQLRSLIVGVTPQTHTIILVGHSYGGLLVTLVAPTLRPRLDSLILLDSAPLIAGEKAREDIEHATAIFSFLPGLSLITTAVARLGVFRLLYALGLAHSDLIDERDALPAQLHAAFLNEFSSPRTYANLGIESRHLFAAWSGAATLLASTSAAVPLLGDTPLLIVRASVAEFPNEEQRAHWLALIAADAAQMLLSRRVTRVAFDKANHFFRGQFAQPFVAALVEFIDRRKLQ